MRSVRPRRLALSAAVLFLLLSASAPLAEEVLARVLLYHRVGEERYPSTNVSAEAFRAQMDWLDANGFPVVSTAELEAAILDGRRLPPRAVVIHFDDAYRSVFDRAFPILRERGLPFTVFLPCDAIDRGYPDFVTWEMVAVMARHGGSFGAHGVRHGRLAPDSDGSGSRSGDDELRTAMEVLRARGIEPRWLAYPYGEYSPVAMREAEGAGYSLAFSQDPGSIGLRSHRFRLPRFAVVGSVGSMATFRERLGYLPLTLGALEPAFGFLATPTPSVFRARVVDPDRYEPGSASVFVSELGQLPARFDPSTGVVSAQGGQMLRRRLNRVLVSLREKAHGGFAVGSWVLLNGSASTP